MNVDWEALSREARDGKPSGLLRALREYARLAQHKLQHVDDYPPAVAALLHDFGRVAQGNGRSKRGRPSKENADLKKAYRAWLRAVARDGYEAKCEMWALAKWVPGARECIDGSSNPLPNGCPSILALQDVADDLGISFEAARDLVFPDRRKNSPKGKARTAAPRKIFLLDEVYRASPIGAPQKKYTKDKRK